MNSESEGSQVKAVGPVVQQTVSSFHLVQLGKTRYSV